MVNSYISWRAAVEQFNRGTLEISHMNIFWEEGYVAPITNRVVVKNCVITDIFTKELSGTITFINCRFESCNFNTAVIRAEFRDCQFVECKFNSTQFIRADVEDCKFISCQLRHTSFHSTYARSVTLEHCSLLFLDVGESAPHIKVINCHIRGKGSINCLPINITGLRYPISVAGDLLQIGCQLHTIDTWDILSDTEIDSMDVYALEFWTKHKQTILQIARAVK